MQTRQQTRMMKVSSDTNLESTSPVEPPPKRHRIHYEPVAGRTRNKMIPDIDFDEASRMWNLNKNRYGSGCYTYIE